MLTLLQNDSKDHYNIELKIQNRHPNKPINIKEILYLSKK